MNFLKIITSSLVDVAQIRSISLGDSPFFWLVHSTYVIFSPNAGEQRFPIGLRWLQYNLFEVGSVSISSLSCIKFIIIFSFFYFIATVSSRGIRYIGKQQRTIKNDSLYVLGKVLHYFILVLGIILSGITLGFDLSSFAFIGSAIAIWIGLSLQSIFHNFISGIIVLLTKTIRINDSIEFDTREKGTVRAINLRATILETPRGSELVIPNSEFVSKKFINHTLSTVIKRWHIPFRISLEENKDLIAKIAKESAMEISLTSKEREPEVWMTGFGTNHIKLELVVWINSRLIGPTTVREPQYFWALDNALKEHGIRIPVEERFIPFATEEKADTNYQ